MRRGDPVAGTHDHRWWLWVPALPSLSRGSAGTTIAWNGAKHQPEAVRNDGRRRFPVSGLFFTGNGATPTCWVAEGACVTPMSPSAVVILYVTIRRHNVLWI